MKKSALFPSLAALLIAGVFSIPAIGYEYQEVGARLDELPIHAAPRFSSPVLIRLERDQTTVLLETSTWTATLDGRSDVWLKVAVPSSQKTGWVFGGQATRVTAPEVYEFRIDRAEALAAAEETLKSLAKNADPRVKPMPRSDVPYVGAVFGTECEQEKPSYVLVSFLQKQPGRRFNLFFLYQDGNFEFLDAKPSLNQTGWWELDDLRESEAGCDEGDETGEKP